MPYLRMNPKKNGLQPIGFIIWLCLTWGCGLSQTTTPPFVPAPTALVSPPPTPVISATVTNAAAVTRTPVPPDTGWLTLRPGLEQRTINILDTNTGQQRESVTILRLDPALFTFNVAYHPDSPISH